MVHTGDGVGAVGVLARTWPVGKRVPTYTRYWCTSVLTSRNVLLVHGYYFNSNSNTQIRANIQQILQYNLARS
eukprot:3374070-Rhodomonas_salina.1